MNINVAAATLAGFERRDWLTITASAAALCVSTLTYLQRWRAGQLALRKQLTDLLQKLSDLALQADLFRALENTPKRQDYPRNYLALLNDQRRFLVRQAEFIARAIVSLVSPYEFLLIASAFDAVGDGAQAERYFEVAVNSAGEPVDRGIALRQFGHYLFSQGHRVEGRENYTRAVAAFAGDSDRLRLHRAQTYARWAHEERVWEESAEAAKQLAAAKAECVAISNPRRRQHEMHRLFGTQSEPGVESAELERPTSAD